MVFAELYTGPRDTEHRKHASTGSHARYINRNLVNSDVDFPFIYRGSNSVVRFDGTKDIRPSTMWVLKISIFRERKWLLQAVMVIITLQSHKRHGVSNHWRLDGFKSLSRLTTKKTPNSESPTLCEGIPLSGDSPHKGPIARNAFPWWRHQMEIFSALLALCGSCTGGTAIDENLIKVRGIHLSPANSIHKGQWRRALMFSLICARTNCWANHADAGELRRHRAHYDVIVMPRRDVFMHCQTSWKCLGKNNVLTWASIPVEGDFLKLSICLGKSWNMSMPWLLMPWLPRRQMISSHHWPRRINVWSVFHEEEFQQHALFQCRNTMAYKNIFPCFLK